MILGLSVASALRGCQESKLDLIWGKGGSGKGRRLPLDISSDFSIASLVARLVACSSASPREALRALP